MANTAAAVICYGNSDNAPHIHLPQLSSTGSTIHSGRLIEEIREAAALSKFDIEFVARPWLRCQKQVINNTYQAIFAIISTPQRIKQYAFPPDNGANQLYEAQYPIFVKKDGIIDDPLKLVNAQNQFNNHYYLSVKQFGLGAPAGFVVEQILKEHNALANIKVSPMKGLKLVANGKLDGYSVETEIGMTLLKRLKVSDQVIPTHYALKKANWHVAFNKAFYKVNKEKVEQFWFELEKIRKRSQRKIQLN